jgi:hypothetical protein
MKADRLPVGRIFDGTERFEAPLFQRPYVWNEEDNWVPLWEAAQTLIRKRAAEQRVRPHFLGTIVLDQLKTRTGHIHSREIVDGQQRLTTFQLMLAAARDLCRDMQQNDYAAAFDKLAKNDAPLSKEDDELFKVWPTNADRDLFRRIMLCRNPLDVAKMLDGCERDDRLMARGYIYFYDRFKEWLSPSNGDVPGRLRILHQVLTDDLLLVVIDLDESDDSQEIFETLNALGTPLLPADLVKNFLFRKAESLGLDTQALYHRYWEMYDIGKSYWRKRVRQGRLNRPRLDLFLGHYLTLMTGDEVSATKLFTEFREYVGEAPDANTIQEQMKCFSEFAGVYRSFEDFSPDTRDGLFFQRLAQMDTTTVFPLLLEVYKHHGDCSRSRELAQILTDVESFLARRTICELTPKNYNNLFAQMARQLRSGGSPNAGAVRALLRADRADTSRWPDDEELHKAWVRLLFYKRLPRPRLRMVLEACDTAMRGPKTEIVKIELGLTIEHLMPVGWRESWPLPCESGTPESYEAATRRDEVIHHIGNLTLLNKRLNPSVSNGPWDRKLPAILKHSALNLNRPLADYPGWDEESIERRSEELFHYAVAVWPYPKS